MIYAAVSIKPEKWLMVIIDNSDVIFFILLHCHKTWNNATIARKPSNHTCDWLSEWFATVVIEINRKMWKTHLHIRLRDLSHKITCSASQLFQVPKNSRERWSEKLKFAFFNEIELLEEKAQEIFTIKNANKRNCLLFQVNAYCKEAIILL